MTATIVLLNRDLRVHDHPALADACRTAETVVPLFVIDKRITAGPNASPNRAALLVDALADLRNSLRARGGDLVIARGDPVTEALALANTVGATAINVSADVSPLARRRESALRTASGGAGIEVRVFPGVTVVPPDDVLTKAGKPYRVFTPFVRSRAAAEQRPIDAAPEHVPFPAGIATGALPTPEEVTPGPRSAHLPRGGETEARVRLTSITRNNAQGEDRDEDLADDRSSRLGAALHLGCVSPLEVAATLASEDRLPHHEAMIRSLAWRDYFHQLLHHHPQLTSTDFRPRAAPWRDANTSSGASEDFDAWCDGRTGYPIVDAAMRQLRTEGWIPNRLRMLVTSVLTKHLGIDWRLGAAHFMRWLIDGDVANNMGNWQWVAGTGTDTRPNRILSPVRQAQRFDPSGAYVRRHLPELAGIQARDLHEPWRIDPSVLEGLGYPSRIFDHELTAAAFRATGAADRSARSAADQTSGAR